MRRFILLALLALPAAAQSSPAYAGNTWERLHYLLGTWQAKTASVGSAKADVSGAYTFREDLDGHAIVRTSTADTCSSQQPFDCKHHDLLTVFQDDTYPRLGDVFALYLDSEGHTIHYVVSMPDTSTAVFSSQSTAQNAPSFRLVYHLENGIMSGKFQFAPPGSTDYKSYLEWSGSKR